jgi:hypothetical protein
MRIGALQAVEVLHSNVSSKVVVLPSRHLYTAVLTPAAWAGVRIKRGVLGM